MCPPLQSLVCSSSHSLCHNHDLSAISKSKKFWTNFTFYCQTIRVIMKNFILTQFVQLIYLVLMRWIWPNERGCCCIWLTAYLPTESKPIKLETNSQVNSDIFPYEECSLMYLMNMFQVLLASCWFMLWFKKQSLTSFASSVLWLFLSHTGDSGIHLDSKIVDTGSEAHTKQTILHGKRAPRM